MATLEAEEQARQELISTLDKITEINPVDLVRKEELGNELNFEPGLPYFERTIHLFRELRNSNLEILPHSAIVDLQSIANQAKGEFANIIGFSFQKFSQNALPTREQFINAVRDSYDNYWSSVTPRLAYISKKDVSLEVLEAQIRETLKSSQAIEAQLKTEAESHRAEMASMLESMRRAAAEAGVSQHSIHFKTEADEHARSAKRWLVATILTSLLTFAAATVTVIFYAYWAKDLDLSSTQSIQLAAAKIVAFSVLFFSMAICNKSYRAHRHNSVVNRHRQNALGTFQAFVKGTDDETTKNAVLLRSTETVFGPSTSGYVSGETETQSYPQVLEIIKSAIDNK